MHPIAHSKYKAYINQTQVSIRHFSPPMVLGYTFCIKAKIAKGMTCGWTDELKDENGNTFFVTALVNMAGKTQYYRGTPDFENLPELDEESFDAVLYRELLTEHRKIFELNFSEDFLKKWLHRATFRAMSSYIRRLHEEKETSHYKLDAFSQNIVVPDATYIIDGNKREVNLSFRSNNDLSKFQRSVVEFFLPDDNGKPKLYMLNLSFDMENDKLITSIPNTVDNEWVEFNHMSVTDTVKSVRFLLNEDGTVIDKKSYQLFGVVVGLTIKL